MTVKILGTKYTIKELSVKDDPNLESCDGYCDKTTHTIVVLKSAIGGPGSIGDFEEYKKKVKRHEIIHAFLFESGLHENFRHDEWGHDETTVDWFANQFPKMLEVFKKVGFI